MISLRPKHGMVAILMIEIGRWTFTGVPRATQSRRTNDSASRAVNASRYGSDSVVERKTSRPARSWRVNYTSSTRNNLLRNSRHNAGSSIQRKAESRSRAARPTSHSGADGYHCESQIHRSLRQVLLISLLNWRNKSLTVKQRASRLPRPPAIRNRLHHGP
jgi:hypothetical protein